MEGKKNPTHAKGGESGRSVPFAGDVGHGRRPLRSTPSPWSSLPCPHAGGAGPPSLQAAAPLPPSAAAGLEAGFAISPSVNANIVSAGCPDQNNSLKGPWWVLLRLSTKAPFCQALPTRCLPVRPSVHPASHPAEGAGSGKEPKTSKAVSKGLLFPTAELLSGSNSDFSLMANSGRKSPRSHPRGHAAARRRKASTWLAFGAKGLRLEQNKRRKRLPSYLLPRFL